MGNTQDFWDFLAGKEERPTEVDGQAKAEARTFVASLRRGKMTLAEICGTIGVSRHEASELKAFIEKYPSEEIIVESAIKFRSLVATQFDKLLRGGRDVSPTKSLECSARDFPGSDDYDDFDGVL